MREIMTPEQVADYLQLTTDTIYRLIRRKELAASKIGRSYRIPKEDLETFLLANSSRAEVRKALFRRMMEIAERNPGVNSDDVLEELEQMDEERRLARNGQ
jgi:excisionase family DNA binding protein